MAKELSGLKVSSPNFYFRNDSPYWLSRVQWQQNINKKLALIPEDVNDNRVYGIIELMEPARIKDIEDIFENISKSAYQAFRDINKDIWAYPVKVHQDFTNNPKVIRDGLEDGQRNWIKEVNFFRQRKEHYDNLSQSELQSYHDRIHNYYDSSDADLRLVNSHFFVANKYFDKGINHPCLDSLDLKYKRMTFGDQLEQFEDYDESLQFVKNNFKDNKDKVVGLSIISEKFNRDNPVIENIGSWTPAMLKKWKPSLDDEEAKMASMISNQLIVEMIDKGIPLNTAIQRTIQRAVAKARSDD